MLVGKYWITAEAAINMGPREHKQYAAAVMLDMSPDAVVPMKWLIKEFPPEILEEALARGAASDAVDFLAKDGDPRLFMLREYGWVRTAGQRFNLWDFDCATADLIRNSDYWDSQKNVDEYDVIDVEEFKTHDRYLINIKTLLEGGQPRVLKNLAMGRTTSEVEKEACPQYSTTRFSEIERRTLAGRTGDNPRRRRR